MDNRLLCEITEADIRTYEEDGVVHLRGVIGLDWVERMRDAMDRVIADPGPMGGNISREDGPGRFTFETFTWLYDPDFKALALESPLAEIAARITRSQKMNFLYDFFFAKEPHTPDPTSWHQDLPTVCCHGTQVTGSWMPLDVVTYESSAPEYIRGSHRWNRWFDQIYDSGQSPEDYTDTYIMLPEGEARDEEKWGEHIEQQPDFEAMRDQYDIISFDSEPGDVVLNNLLVVHGAPGNHSDRRRRAVGGRWAGDDTTFARRKGAHNVNIPAEVDLKDGDPFPPDHPLFPLAWPKSSEARAST